MIYDKLIQAVGKEKVLRDVPLREYISFRVGGPCTCMVFPVSSEDISKAVEICVENQTPYYFLGNGTNVIALDEGFPGVIIKIGKDFADIRIEGETIIAQAGALLSAVSRRALENSLTGMEFAGGIPGSVGGGILMNAGAYDGELKNIVESVVALDKYGNAREYLLDECEFSYRDSVFQRKELIVLEARFKLSKGDKEKISDKMADLMKRRNEKQPLNYPSAGSTFKRPAGSFAGKLIQDCGLKGLTHGGAQVSELHAGFVINTGNATASDILELIEIVKNTVYDRYKVMLHTEVRLIK